MRTPRSSVTPSASSARWTTAAASGSSRGSTWSMTSRSVTSLPNRAKVWAISQPIGPAPTIAMRRGSSVSSNRVWLVR